MTDQPPPELPSRRVKTPTVIQMEAVECGAAALSIILRYYGRYVSLEELRTRCGVSRDGVNAYNMTLAANSYGLEATGYSLKTEHIAQAMLPCILFWENNHFVVLEGFKKDRVYINDPATGPRWIYWDEFAESYSQVVLEMKTTPAFEKVRAPTGLLASVMKRIAPFADSIAYLFFIQFFLVVLGLAIPVFTQVFIDKILGESILEWKGTYITLLAGVMCVVGFLTWMQGAFLNALQIRLAIRYSTDFLWHILQLPISFFTQRFGAEIINRMRLNKDVAQTLTGQVVITTLNALLIGFYALIMLAYDVWITVVGIATALINVAVLYFVSRRRRNAYARFQQEQAKTIGVSIDALLNIETMKTSCNDSFFFSRIAGYYTRNINALQVMGNQDAWLFSLSSFSQQFTTVFLLAFGCWRVMHGHLTIGMLIALQLILTSFLTPFRQLVEFGARIQTFRTDLNRLDDVLENATDPILKDAEPAKPLSQTFHGDLEFKNVTFGYSPFAPPLFTDINFKVKKGQWVALVGSVGAGKTTLAKLACSLYAPWKGEVLYDGKPRQEYPRELLMRSLATIDQDIFLFSGTIRDNLTLWNPSISEQALVEAAKDACIHDDILMRSEGYHAKVLERGSNFSAGQRQRLEIARALVLNPELLVMDEATNSLDTETESRVMENIRKRGCSCLIVAHRLSTVQRCDEIIVLEKGRVVQRGTHETLKGVPGLYQEFLKLEDFK